MSRKIHKVVHTYLDVKVLLAYAPPKTEDVIMFSKLWGICDMTMKVDVPFAGQYTLIQSYGALFSPAHVSTETLSFSALSFSLAFSLPFLSFCLFLSCCFTLSLVRSLPVSLFLSSVSLSLLLRFSFFVYFSSFAASCSLHHFLTLFVILVDYIALSLFSPSLPLSFCIASPSFAVLNAFRDIYMHGITS